MTLDTGQLTRRFTRQFTSVSTLHPLPPPPPPSLQTAEDLYSRRLGALRGRIWSIQLIGPDGVPYRTWYSIYVEDQVNRLAELPKGWDARHAKRTTEEAVRTAANLLFAISNDQSVRPQFFPLPDGGIQFEWHVAGTAIEIEVDGAGEAFAVAVDADGKVLFEDDVTVEQTAKLSLLRALISDLPARAAGIG